MRNYIDEIRYEIDGDVYDRLKNKIKSQQDEILYLKMQLEDYKKRTSASFSVTKSPDIISAEHCVFNLNLACTTKVEFDENRVHVINEILKNKEHNIYSYHYFLDERMFHHVQLHQKQMILIGMHKSLINNIIFGKERNNES